MIYFDVTDIVNYAQVDSRVSGIQRVQARIISNLRKKLGPGNVQAIYAHPTSGGIFAFDPSKAFESTDFDAIEFLQLLNLHQASRIPPKNQVRKYLRPYDNRKILRALKKMDLYARSILKPGDLESLGINTRRPSRRIKPIDMHPITSLEKNDRLVFLGSNWQSPKMMQMAITHKARGGNVIQMIHDIIPTTAPWFCPPDAAPVFNSFLDGATKFTTKFACVSEYSRRELENYLEGQSNPGKAAQLSVIRLAHEFSGYARITASQDAIQSTAPQRPYVLFVGTIENRKNVLGILRTWRTLVNKVPDITPDIVFAGKYGWDAVHFKNFLAENPTLRKFTRVVLAPSDQALSKLYADSLFCLYPSHFEGWGLPVGEAAWFGKPTITSDCTSLPEVCGDLAIYVNPADDASIFEAVHHFLKNPGAVHALECRIRSAQLRSWSDVADDLYHNCLT
jgi:glycosyltransferase involved in cell wall biosynthesis